MNTTDAGEDIRAAKDGAAFTRNASHGLIEVTGADRLDLLHRLSTNDLLKLKTGDVTSTVFVTDKGRIIDHVIVVVRASSLLLITSSGAVSRLLQWIGKYTITEDIQFSPINGSTSMIWMTGAHVDSIVKDGTGFTPQRSGSGFVAVNGGEVDIAAHDDSRGRALYLVFHDPRSDEARKQFEAVAFSAGARVLGSSAYETYRISRGIGSPGRELTDAYNPYDAGLREDISFTKGCYIGQEVIARLDTYQKNRRALVGIDFGEASPGHEQQILLRAGKDVGVLTSVAPSTVLDRHFGLGIVSDVAAGDELTASESGTRGIVRDFPLGGS